MGPDSPEEPSSACILHDSCSGEVGSTSSNNTPFRRWEMAAAAGIVHQEALQEKKRCRGRLGVEVEDGGEGGREGKVRKTAEELVWERRRRKRSVEEHHLESAVIRIFFLPFFVASEGNGGRSSQLITVSFFLLTLQKEEARVHDCHVLTRPW